MNIVISGASKGIGKAIAVKFASCGHDLFLCARNIGTLEATAMEIQKNYPASRVMVMVADLSVKDQVIAFGNWCLSQAVPDVIVNNSGIYLPGNVIDVAEGQIEYMMNSNFYSAYHLTRSFLPSMIKNGKGHIFNMCSIASLNAYEGGGSYSVSKFALNGFTKNLRHELKTYGVKVTAVFPGAVLTDSWGNFDNSSNRIIEASDIAELIYTASILTLGAVVDEIHITPQLGNL